LKGILNMPKVLEVDGYRFFFFSNEGDPREPYHIHVSKGDALAKFWIDPEVELADSIGFSAKELNFIKGIVSENKEVIKEAWDGFFQ